MNSTIKRYTTANLVEKADEEVQKILWLLLDMFLSETIMPDYLQIFELSTVRIGNEHLQKILHRQEEPLCEREEGFFQVETPHEGTIWFKLENELQSMLLPGEW